MGTAGPEAVNSLSITRTRMLEIVISVLHYSFTRTSQEIPFLIIDPYKPSTPQNPKPQNPTPKT